MKKLFLTLALLLITAFSLPAPASAATNPGVKPGNFFYFFDTTFEQIGLFFTFSSEKKAEKALAYADERLAEAEAIAGDNNAEAVKTAITNYESNIALAAEKSKEVQDKEKAENLFTLIADNTLKNQEVLSAVLIKVPEEAKEAIMRAIEASRKGQEEAIQQIAELKSEIEQLKKEVTDLKAENEVQMKTVEKLNKQKSENVSIPAKSPTPPVPGKPAVPNQSQVLLKANEPQNTPLTNQQLINTITSPPPVSVTPPTPVETFEITSVSVVPDMTSAKIEWQTNKPTESKVFISGGNLSSKIFNSISGLSTRHSATITGLSEETSYSYEIEAIAGGTNAVKKQGNFNTLPLPQSTSSILIKEEGLSYGGIVIHLNIIGEENILLKKLPIKILSNTSGFIIKAKDMTFFPGSNVQISGILEDDPFDNFTDFEISINKVIYPDMPFLVGVYFSNPVFPKNYVGDNKATFQAIINKVKNIEYAIGKNTNGAVEISEDGFISSVLKL